MDDILIKIDTTNDKIEQILDKGIALNDTDVTAIQQLYLDKSRLIEKFVAERNKISSQEKINLSPDYWQKKLNNHISKDKRVLEKLGTKVDYLADKIRNDQKNKKLLIYKQVSK